MKSYDDTIKRQDTLTCSENEWVIGKYPYNQYLESTHIFDCKVLILYDKEFGGMLHIQTEKGIRRIKELISEINKFGKDVNSLRKVIAMKTLGKVYEDDNILQQIANELTISIEEIHSYIIAMDGKKIVTLSLKNGTIQRY